MPELQTAQIVSPATAGAALVGRPFADGGRGPEAYDCWGLVLAVYRAVTGKTLPDWQISADDAAAVYATAVGEVDAGRWLRVDRPEALDVALYCVRPDGLATHTGIFLNRLTVLQTTRRLGAHVVAYSGPFWRQRLVGVYRWQG